MAERRNARSDDPRPRRKEPSFSHSPDDEEEDSEDEAGSAGILEKLQNIPWIKQNPNLAKGALAGVLLTLMLLLFAWQLGWFSSAPTRPPVGPAQPQTLGQAPPAPQPVPPPPAGGANPPGQPPGGPAAGTGAKKTEETRALPDDVTKWKKDDYFRARQENNPKLLEAVTRLGENAATRGSEPAGQGLTDLLKPVPPPAPPSSASPAPGEPPPMVRPVMPKLQGLVEKIVAALGNNGSKTARDTLEQILSGTFATDDDRAAVGAALTALAAHPGAENDALLLRAVVTPDALRPPDRQGIWTARELRTTALELVRQAPPDGVRVRLAEALADRFSKLEPTDPLRQLLLAADPRNCAAQVLLYEKGRTTREVKTELEKLLTGYSALGLARLLEVREDNLMGPMYVQPVYSQPAKPDPDLGPRLAGLLWSEKFRALLDPSLEELRSLESQSPLVLLAATIPQDSTRELIAKALLKHRIDGPRSLDVAGLADRLVTDPGLVVSIKAIKMPLRKESKPGTKPVTAPPPRAGKPPRTPPASTSGKVADALKAAQRKEQAEQEWSNTLSKLVSAWCNRLYAASLAKEKAAMESGKPVSDAPPKLPSEFKLAPDAKVVTAYHLLWPDEAPPGVSALNLSPLEVHYIRVEETNKVRKAIAFYGPQVQAKAADARTLDRATWLDGLKSLPGDRRRSYDVLITRSDNKTGEAAKDDEEIDLVVEILAIEIKDPAAGIEAHVEPRMTIEPRSTRIGWIGAGVMGASMCGHLIRAGFSATVFNRTRAKAQPLLAAGAAWADSPRAVAAASDVIFTMVGYPADVRQVILGAEGVLAGCKPGNIVVDMTTTEPSLAAEIAQAAAPLGVHAVDAPVSGGGVGAREARLSIMIGGEPDVIESLRPCWQAMGKTFIRQGGPGAGQHAKMVNQVIIAGNIVGVCEGLLYAYKAGLDLETLMQSVASGAAGSWSLSNLGPRIIANNFAPGFFVEHFIKDLGIALAEAKRMGLCLPGLALANQLYLSLAAHGHGRAGTQALQLALASMSNVDWPRR